MGPEPGIGPIACGGSPGWPRPAVVASGSQGNTPPVFPSHKRGDLIVACRYSFDLTPDTIAAPWSNLFTPVVDTNICTQLVQARASADNALTDPFTATSNTWYWYVIIRDGQLILPDPVTACYFHNGNSNGYTIQVPAVATERRAESFVIGAEMTRNNVGTELSGFVDAKPALTRLFNRTGAVRCGEVWKTAVGEPFAGFIDTLTGTNHARSFGIAIQVAPWQ